MTVFERPKGSGNWAAKYVENRKQIWVPGAPFPSKSAAREAERRHREYLAARRSAETCASFAERWLAEWPRSAPGTRRQYRRAAMRFSEHFGPTLLGDVERLSARTWSLTVARYIPSIVRTMYEDARNVGLVESNPFDNLRLPRTESTGQVKPPTLDQFSALLEATTCLGGYAPEFRAMIQFAAWTGVRAGELQGLHWEDVGSESIEVKRARRRDGTHGPPKNGKARTIAFLPPARVLEDVPRRPDPFVFHSPRGKELDQGSMFYAWREVRALAGLPSMRWHDLRHFCATQLLELGLDHFAVSVQLGHTDGGALVMERYGHPSESAARSRLLDAFAADVPEIVSYPGSRVAGGGVG